MDNPTTIREPKVKAARRIAEAYLKMARVANYRPEAPGPGTVAGGRALTEEQLASRDLLEREAVAYAGRFIWEENTHTFFIGVSNFNSNRAFVYTIEAARLMAGADEKRAAVLLTLALMELLELLEGKHG
jgi:hypothetical protein